MSGQGIFAKNLLKGRRAVVTGGGTGIGFAISKMLMSLGCDVLIASRKAEALKQAAEVLQSETDGTGKVFTATVDIRKEQQVKEMFETFQRVFNTNKLDVLVNNAGGQFPSRAEDISSKGFRTVVDLNLNATFDVCRLAFPLLKNADSPTISNIICDMKCGFPMMAHTGAARAGVENLTKSLAIEWGPHNIRVNAIAPGVVVNESAKLHYLKNTGDDSFLESAAPFTVAKRPGTSSEVACAVVFLSSPASSYVTGETIYVDGGSRLYGPTLPLDFIPSDKVWPYPKM